MAVFSIVSARERRGFWTTLPSRTLAMSIIAVPKWQALAIFAYAMVSCLVVNDAVKVAMIKWRVSAAAA